jgi:hypothetical protein
MIPVAWFHMRLGGIMILCAFITLTEPVMIAMVGAAIYLYYSISGHMRKLYFDRLKWISWIYNLVYYALFTACYGLQYLLYLKRVQTEEGYLFTSEGAFYSYVYKIFPLVIVCHFVLIIIRWLVRTLVLIVKESLARRNPTAVEPSPEEEEVKGVNDKPAAKKNPKKKLSKK